MWMTVMSVLVWLHIRSTVACVSSCQYMLCAVMFIFVNVKHILPYRHTLEDGSSLTFQGQCQINLTPEKERHLSATTLEILLLIHLSQLVHNTNNISLPEICTFWCQIVRKIKICTLWHASTTDRKRPKSKYMIVNNKMLFTSCNEHQLDSYV